MRLRQMEHCAFGIDFHLVGVQMTNICKRPPYSKASAQDKKLDGEYQVWCRTLPCAKCGSQGEYVESKGRCFSQYAHSTIGGKGGKGIKALLSGLPLCGDCHTIQHQHGHLALAPREWWIETPKAVLRRFLQLVR